jgi:hypothetical protein
MGTALFHSLGGTMRALIAALSIALLPANGVGLAHADNTDDQYLALLSSHGITGQPDELIAASRQACELAGLGNAGGFAGPYLAAMTNLDNTLTAMGFNKAQKQQLAVDAARTYCPQFAPPR